MKWSRKVRLVSGRTSSATGVGMTLILVPCDWSDWRNGKVCGERRKCRIAHTVTWTMSPCHPKMSTMCLFQGLSKKSVVCCSFFDFYELFTAQVANQFKRMFNICMDTWSVLEIILCLLWLARTGTSPSLEPVVIVPVHFLT